MADHSKDTSTTITTKFVIDTTEFEQGMERAIALVRQLDDELNKLGLRVTFTTNEKKS